MLTDSAQDATRSLQGGSSVFFLGLGFQQLTLDELLAQLRAADPSRSFTYVVTPNVDHLVRLTGVEGLSDERLWEAYRAADWCVNDSKVVGKLARLKGLSLPAAPGSDLTARLFANVIEEGDVIALVGGDRDLLERLRSRFRGVRFVQHIPPMGMRHNPAAMAEAALFVRDARARFTFLAVGSPQQELLAHEIKRFGGAGGIGLCIGAAVRFVAGLEARAPLALQRIGLEWAHRLLSNPRRMWRRYLWDGPRIFWRVARWDAKQ